MDAASVAAGTSASSGAGAATDRFSQLGSDEFLKIIFTELRNQDPLEPNDTTTLLEQLSSLRSIQSEMSFTSRLGELVGQNEFAAAAQLIGREVAGRDAGGVALSGVVASVVRTSDGPVLTLADGTRLALGDVEQVLGTPGGDAP